MKTKMVKLFWITSTALLIAALNTGCAPSAKPKFQETLSSDRTPRRDLEGTLAECNHVVASQMGTEAYVSTFYNPNTRELVADYLQMKLKGTPSILQNTSGQVMKFFRWGMSDSGSRTYNTIATEFSIYSDVIKKYLPQTTPFSVLSKANIEKWISDNDLGSKGVTLANFFSTHHLVFYGMEASYDALDIAAYATSSSTTPSSNASLLIPIFHADPNTYGSGHHAYLNVLHPFWSEKSSGLTDEQYFQKSEEICNEMFQL